MNSEKAQPKKLYLAGPMRGYADHNFPAFFVAAQRLREQGFRVMNPAENGSMTLNGYLIKDSVMVANADLIAVLPGWQDSKGAQLEVMMANYLGIPVYEAEPLARSGSLVMVAADINMQHARFAVDEMRDRDQHQVINTLPAEEAGEEALRSYTGGGGRLPTRTEQVQALIKLNTMLDQPKKTLIQHVQETAAPDAIYGLTPGVRGTHDYAGKLDGGGYKGSMDNPQKLPIWLVPKAYIESCARSLRHGAKKYAPNNWRRGMAYTEVYSALQRHLLAWLEREGPDEDSGLSHLDHAAACLAFLCEYEARPEYHKFDNRLVRPEEPDVFTSQGHAVPTA